MWRANGKGILAICAEAALRLALLDEKVQIPTSYQSLLLAGCALTLPFSFHSFQFWPCALNADRAIGISAGTSPHKKYDPKCH